MMMWMGIQPRVLAELLIGASRERMAPAVGGHAKPAGDGDGDGGAAAATAAPAGEGDERG